MVDHAVIIVHGVGEQIPGHTVDEAVAGAIAEHEKPGGATPEIHSENFTLPEVAFSGAVDASVANHVVPFRVNQRLLIGKGEDGNTRKTVFAEVFWADRSPAPVGVFATFSDLVRNVLGIGYLALDNVQNTSGRCSQWVVYAFLWMFYTLVAPLNAMLAIVVVSISPALVVQSLEIETAVNTNAIFQSNWTILLAGFLALGARRLFRKPEKDEFILNCFWNGLQALGLATITGAVFLLATKGAQSSFFIEKEFPFGLHGLHYCAGILVVSLSFVWGVCILLCVLSYCLWLWEKVPAVSVENNEPNQVRIFAPVLSGMLLIWFTIVVAFWMVFQYLLSNHEISEPLVSFMSETVTLTSNTLIPNGLSILLLFFVSLVVLLGRQIWRHSLRDKAETSLRLLLNPYLQVVFAFSTAAMVVLVIFQLAWWGRDHPPALVGVILNFNTEYRAAFIWLFIGLGLSAYYSINSLSSILGIARDVVSYSTTSTPLAEDSHPSPYSIRQALDTRFGRVLDHVLTHHKPKRITIIAHSFGSLVAVRYLQNKYPDGPPREMGVLKLITMGSPVSHIYGQYFCKDFALKDGYLNKANWTNLFRTGDYVGTKILDCRNRVQDVEIGTGGHTGYWTDDRFWDGVTKRAGFKLF